MIMQMVYENVHYIRMLYEIHMKWFRAFLNIQVYVSDFFI